MLSSTALHTASVLFTIFSWIFTISTVECTIYYVNPSNPKTSENGRSWDEAFTDLEVALTIADKINDEIWLKGDETYRPSVNNRADCFETNIGIKIYGGFVGNEALKEDRPTDITSNPSIITGDINIEDTDTDNCYHVITYSNILTLDRVTITSGYANYNDDYYDISTDYLTRQTNMIHKYGAALITLSTQATTELYINDVTFTNNTAINGGALWFTSNDKNNVAVTITNSYFMNNEAIFGSHEGGYGGAIYFYQLANLKISNTEFINNFAESKGGALYQDYGGILECSECKFIKNEASGYGGALFAEDRNSQTSGTFPKLISTEFTDNFAKIYGGAVCFFNGVQATFVNNVFNNNDADNGGAIALINSEIINNTGNTFSNNQAALNASTDNMYSETAFSYDTMNDVPEFNVTNALKDLFATYNAIQAVTDVRPYINDNRTCYVDSTNAAYKDGMSWQYPFPTVQECIDFLELVGGGEIWVKYGSYNPTDIPEWKARIGKVSVQHRSIIMRENIRMYGGFKGDETMRSQRNFAQYPTYLSCKIRSNSYCNEIMIGADNSVVDGFIFVDAGYGSLSTVRRLANSISVEEVLSSTGTKSGSGVYSNSTTITVVNSIFLRLFSSGKGGAVYCIGLEGTNLIKSPAFINVQFLGNRAVSRGGAISADASCNFECNHCIFDSNSVSGKGGAIYLDFDSDIVISNSIFKNNYARDSGGCIAADGKSLVIMENPQFMNNSARWDGGCLYSGSGVGNRINQGFEIYLNNILPLENNIFIDNSLLNNNPGQSNVYLWPYSSFILTDQTYAPTANPTSEPSMSPTLPSVSPTLRPSLSPTTPTLSPTPQTPPNILIFLIDDIQYTQSWNHSAPATHLKGTDINYLDIPTPNINRIMEEGIIFPRAYAAGPKCAPSRYGILTGRQAVRSQYAIDRTLATSSGIFGTDISVPVTKMYSNDLIYNIPNVLKNNVNAPFATGMIGKYHLMTSNDNGYDYGCSSLASYPNETLYDLCRNIVTDMGFEFVDGFYHSNIATNSYFSHNPEWMVERAQTFIDQSVVDDKPFFLYFAPTLTHSPDIEAALFNYSIADTPKGKLTGNDIPNNTGMNNRSYIWQQALNSNSKNGNRMETVAGNIWIDDAFGAILNHLEDNFLLDDTVVIVMNDHGMGSKGTLYEQGSRIIQYIRYPKLFDGGYILPNDFIVSNVDLASVIFQITNVDVQTVSPGYKMDGKNWLNDVINEIKNVNGGQSASCCKYRYVDNYNSHAIISKNYKYIYRATSEIETDGSFATYYNYVNDTQQLYNVISDPNEQNNLIHNISLKDTIFDFQYKMLNYIHNTACYASNIDDCMIPDIQYIPPYSNYSLPTPAPTLPGYTCDEIVDWSYKWRRVLRWTESKSGDIYKDNAEQTFLADHPECGTNSATLEYVYKFSYASRQLIIDIMACCPVDRSFGTSWIYPLDYKPNSVFSTNIISDLDNNNNIKDDDWRPIVLSNLILFVLIAICVSIFWVYKTRQNNKHIESLNQLIQKQKKQIKSHDSNINNNNGNKSSAITSVELSHNSTKNQRESIVKRHIKYSTDDLNYAIPMTQLNRVHTVSQSGNYTNAIAVEPPKMSDLNIVADLPIITDADDHDVFTPETPLIN